MDDIEGSDSTCKDSGNGSVPAIPERRRGSAHPIARSTASPRKFVPPAWAWKAIELTISEPKMHVKERCAQVGIVESTWFRALKRPQFAEWFNRQCAELVQAHLGLLHSATMQYALEGNAAYARLAYDRFDENFCPKEKHLIQPQAPPMVIVCGEPEPGGLLSRLPRSPDGRGVLVNVQPAKGPQWDDGPPEELIEDS